MTRGIQYQKGDFILYVSPVFTYEVSVIRIFKGRTETIYRSNKYSLDPINITGSSRYVKHLSYTDVYTIEWVGAPKSFLIKNKFKKL